MQISSFLLIQPIVSSKNDQQKNYGLLIKCKIPIYCVPVEYLNIIYLWNILILYFCGIFKYYVSVEYFNIVFLWNI